MNLKLGSLLSLHSNGKTKLFFSGSVLAGSLMAANAINLLFNAYLGRTISTEDFGVIALINTFIYIGSIFTNSLLNLTNAEVASLKQTKNKSDFFVSINKQVLITSLILTIVWVLVTPYIASFFHITNYLILYLFTPVLLIYPLAATSKGFLQGKFLFYLTGIIILIEPAIKFISAFSLIYLGLHSWVYLSVYISAVLTGLIALIIVLLKSKISFNNSPFSFPYKFFAAALLVGASSISYLALDMVLVKHFLSPSQAGEYAILTLLGKIVYFSGTLLNIFTISIANQSKHSKNPLVSFSGLFIGSALLSLIAVVILGVFGNLSIPLIFGAKANSILPFALPYVSAMAMFTLGGMVVTYHLALKEYLFPVLSLSMSLLLTIGILFFHNSLTQIVYVLLTVGIIYSLGLLTAHFYKHIFTPKIAFSSIEQNIKEEI